MCSLRAALVPRVRASLVVVSNFVAAAVVTLAASLLGPPALAAEPLAVDTVLRGGQIYDGSGGPPLVADLAIRDGRIVAIGPRLQVTTAAREVDCAGLAVAPGFIDLHNHSDDAMVAAATRANVNYLTQGCTTIVTGNCGGGPVDVAAYFKKIDTSGAGTNVIHLLPHGSLRAQVMGRDNRRPTAEELAKMRTIAAQAMSDGAWGMSTGLIYVPGTFAETDELIEIAKVVGAAGGIYASHIRNEGTGLLDSIDEMLRIGRDAQLPVHVSHFKASGKDAWGTLRVAAETIEKARAAGQMVTADQYPYVASSTSLEATLFPNWAREGGSAKLRERLNDPETFQRIRRDVAQSLETKGRIQLASFAAERTWVGKSLDELASAQQRELVDVALDIERRGGARVVHFGMNEEDVRIGMRYAWVATASDGGSKIPDADRPHPRSFGTFSRKIGLYAQREKVLSLAAAIRSNSGLPADILRLKDRGYLKVDQAADIAVFDPEKFIDRATYDDPYTYSTGIIHVFVRGVPAIHAGTPTGALAGVALRRPRD